MKKVDQRVPKNLVITAYWPRRTAEENNIGYAVPGKHIFYYMLIAPFQRSLGWFVEPRVRPALSPVVRVLMLTLPILAVAITFNRGQKHKGFYTLDDQGKPLSFIGYQPPTETLERLGIGRKKFLRQLKKLV
ncbi:hypothetical protein KDW_46460 [Dictyobacter vulcani]|uniref:Uncharacterized protein n=1 Tax=Dictyobacter vulcani TaxID=2607529 RepID=A0A5J4KM83_9CHLR|nr:hypothetical protein [Dictyobacter vulcani]GER90484.1 hypothetical protein KDW_46460 [Dictyobacter vulcani]